MRFSAPAKEKLVFIHFNLSKLFFNNYELTYPFLPVLFMIVSMMSRSTILSNSLLNLKRVNYWFDIFVNYHVVSFRQHTGFSKAITIFVNKEWSPCFMFMTLETKVHSVARSQTKNCLGVYVF